MEYATVGAAPAAAAGGAGAAGAAAPAAAQEPEAAPPEPFGESADVAICGALVMYMPKYLGLCLIVQDTHSWWAIGVWGDGAAPLLLKEFMRSVASFVEYWCCMWHVR